MAETDAWQDSSGPTPSRILLNRPIDLGQQPTLSCHAEGPLNFRRQQRLDDCTKDLVMIAASDRTLREKRNLLRSRMRGLTSRTPRWVSCEARAIGTKTGCVDEHVVPLRFLANRILSGMDPAMALAVADVTCRVSRREDLRIDRIRTRWPDLEEALGAELNDSELINLGWERYRRARIRVTWTGHCGKGTPVFMNEPCPCGTLRPASTCCAPHAAP